MPHPLIAALPAHPEMSEAAGFMTTGFFIVIAALLALSIVVNIISLMFMRGMKAANKRVETQPASKPASKPAASPAAKADAAPAVRKPVAPAAPAERPAAALPAAEPLPEHIAAILVAAVHAALEGQAHRILHIEPASGGWAREGRREIFSSHRFR